MYAVRLLDVALSSVEYFLVSRKPTLYFLDLKVRDCDVSGNVHFLEQSTLPAAVLVAANPISRLHTVTVLEVPSDSSSRRIVNYLTTVAKPARFAIADDFKGYSPTMWRLSQPHPAA